MQPQSVDIAQRDETVTMTALHDNICWIGFIQIFAGGLDGKEKPRS